MLKKILLISTIYLIGANASIFDYFTRNSSTDTDNVEITRICQPGEESISFPIKYIASVSTNDCVNCESGFVPNENYTQCLPSSDGVPEVADEETGSEDDANADNNNDENETKADYADDSNAPTTDDYDLPSTTEDNLIEATSEQSQIDANTPSIDDLIGMVFGHLPPNKLFGKKDGETTDHGVTTDDDELGNMTEESFVDTTSEQNHELYINENDESTEDYGEDYGESTTTDDKELGNIMTEENFINTTSKQNHELDINEYDGSTED